MKRSHLSNFDLPLSPPAAIHSRYRSVSVTFLLDVNVILDVIGIADSVFLALSAVSSRSLRIVRASSPPCHMIVLGIFSPFNEDYISLNE